MSTMKALWANPWMRRPALLALAFGGVLAVCYIVVDQLGKQAWREMQRQIANDGETLDYGSLLPPPIADEENVCAAGVLRNLAAQEDGSSAAGEEGRANRRRITRT